MPPPKKAKERPGLLTRVRKSIHTKLKRAADAAGRPETHTMRKDRFKPKAKTKGAP